MQGRVEATDRRPPRPAVRQKSVVDVVVGVSAVLACLCLSILLPPQDITVWRTVGRKRAVRSLLLRTHLGRSPDGSWKGATRLPDSNGWSGCSRTVQKTIHCSVHDAVASPTPPSPCLALLAMPPRRAIHLDIDATHHLDGSPCLCMSREAGPKSAALTCRVGRPACSYQSTSALVESIIAHTPRRMRKPADKPISWPALP